MNNRFECFSNYISSIYKNIQRLKELKIKEYGLKSIHVMCLFYLRHYENVTNSMLVKLTNEDKGAISRALAYLDENGYISCDKKYKSAILLLEKGKEVAEYIDSESDNAVSFAGNAYNEEERKMFYDMLKTISENLNIYIEKLEK